jgi:hypothetical protein
MNNDYLFLHSPLLSNPTPLPHSTPSPLHPTPLPSPPHPSLYPLPLPLPSPLPPGKSLRVLSTCHSLLANSKDRDFVWIDLAGTETERSICCAVRLCCTVLCCETVSNHKHCLLLSLSLPLSLSLLLFTLHVDRLRRYQNCTVLCFDVLFVLRTVLRFETACNNKHYHILRDCHVSCADRTVRPFYAS